MTGAPSISLSEFTSKINEAVAAAVKRNPSFAVDTEGDNRIVISKLINGIWIDWEIAEKQTLAELQGLADNIAEHVAGGSEVAGGLRAEVLVAKPNSGGIVQVMGHHVVCGIPPVTRVE